MYDVLTERLNKNTVYFYLLGKGFTGYANIRKINKMEYIKVGNKSYFI